MWISIEHEKVGEYRKLYLGFIPSPFVSDDAVKITYLVWLINIKEKKVTAFGRFTGPNPPKNKVEYLLPRIIGERSAYGIAPDDQVLKWMNSLRAH